MCADHDAIYCSTFARIWEIIMQILKVTEIDCHRRRLIRKLYMDQSVKMKLDQWETRRLKIGRGVRSTFTANILPRNFLKSW